MIYFDELRSDGFWKDAGWYFADGTEAEFPATADIGGCVIFKTSGSTGAAKSIVLEKRALLVSARAVNEWLEVDGRSVWGLALPAVHVGGFGVIARSYVAGCGFASFSGKWNVGAFAEWITQVGVTHTSLVPTQVHDLVKSAIPAPSCITAIVVGGGRLEEKLGTAARELGWPVLASYGMTEAGSQIATQRLSALGIPFDQGSLELLPIWEARVGTEGLLSIAGDALFAGMIRMHGTQAGFSPRPPGAFLTKDRVRLDERVLIPEGRADSMVKVMGELVDIEALERKFLEGAAGKIQPEAFAIVPLPDERRGNVLVAAFEGRLGPAMDAYRQYQESAGGLARFDRYVELKEFPRTSLGKLRRADLAERVSIAP
ncbi:MAG: AMP-binding protein [Luteolibacter sp.]